MSCSCSPCVGPSTIANWRKCRLVGFGPLDRPAAVCAPPIGHLQAVIARPSVFGTVSMRSPSATEVMDITNLMNKKGVVSNGIPPISVPDPQSMMSMHHVKSERADSPHGSEHSRYSLPATMEPLHGSPVGRQYMPGPPAMLDGNTGRPYPMQQLPFPPAGAFPRPHQPIAVAHGMPTSPAPKTYHCSTCQKGFARRSDLARHGM